MKNLYLLPTCKQSKIHLGNEGVYFTKEVNSFIPYSYPKNIYIISDKKKIKKGDWVLYNKKYVRKVDETFNQSGVDWNFSNTDKIILTTDLDLVADGVQVIDDEFLGWFVKNPTCEIIEIKSNLEFLGDDYRHGGEQTLVHKIIIPQEEPKNQNNQEIMFHEERKEYFYEDFINSKFVTVWLGKDYIPQEKLKQDSCEHMKEVGCIKDICTCNTGPKQEVVGYRLKSNIDRFMIDGILKYPMPIWNNEDKSVYFIKDHIAGSLVAKLKELQVLDLWFTPIFKNEEVKSDLEQETFEEAAERVFTPRYTNYKVRRQGFIEGAKWHTERMYSSLFKLRNELYDTLPTGDIDAFELLKLIKIHLQKLDDLCGNK
jgi:hypothetical protein